MWRWSMGLGLGLVCTVAAMPAPAGCTIEALGETPVEPSPDGLFMMPAAIKSQPINLLVDTGAMLTTLNLAIVDRLRLPRDIVRGEQIESAFGRAQALARTTVPELVIGGETLRHVAMLVVMGPAMSDHFDGILGSDFLTHFDLEFDLANGKLRFFRQSHCGDTGAVYWSDRYSQLPIWFRSNHIIVPVTLDGHELSATLDSGAARTTLSWRTAERLGLERNSPQLRHDGWSIGLDDARFPVVTYGFAELKIAGETIRQPRLAISELEMKDADMILGADFLKAHRVYAATGDNRLYFTWNGSAGFAR